MNTLGFASESNIQALYETAQPWLLERGEYSATMTTSWSDEPVTLDLPTYTIAIPGEALRKVVPQAVAVLAIGSAMQIDYCPAQAPGDDSSRVDFWIGRPSSSETISLHGPDHYLPWTTDRYHYGWLTEQLSLDELLERLFKTAQLEAATGIDRLTREEYQALLAIATHLDDLKTPAGPK